MITSAALQPLTTRGTPSMDEGIEAYEKRYRQQRVKSLTAKAKDLGYQLTPLNA